MLHLLVGIDTESDNQWDVDARLRPRFENIYALSDLHALFARHGVRPTYLITYPVATDARSAETLRQLRAKGGCEIGAHHHAWETPPCEVADAQRHLYASALTADRFEQQLEALTAAIAGAVGERPTAYRSGRFGFSAAHVAPLERAGYLVESSVAPLFCERHKGGPDFVGASLTPYFLSYDDARRAGTSRVVELPVSAALNRRVPSLLERAYGHAPRPYLTRRVLRKLGIARMVWLRPSYSSLDDMKALARRIKDDGVPCLNLLFHSSEAIAGGSPYTRTAEELHAFVARLEQFFEYAVGELGAIPATFGEFHARFCTGGVATRGNPS
jgi:peptidoglycan/xylan/chitin deacetylase (PgdA/CDA1 family)